MAATTVAVRSAALPHPAFRLLRIGYLVAPILFGSKISSPPRALAS
jgi:hypothetical protein